MNTWQQSQEWFRKILQHVWKNKPYDPLTVLQFYTDRQDFFFFFFCFLGPHLWHMEVPRLGFKSEWQLLACATATATQDLSCTCNLHHSSWQRQILNSLSEARDQTHILVDTSQVSNLLSHNRTSQAANFLDTFTQQGFACLIQ